MGIVDPHAAPRLIKFDFRIINWFLIENAVIGPHPGCCVPRFALNGVFGSFWASLPENPGGTHHPRA
jgi:hypothetical protein